MKNLSFILFLFLLTSCSKDDSSSPAPIEMIRGADMSYLPLIESEGTVYRVNNTPQDALTTLKNAGCNTIRIRLWKNPINGHSGFEEVKTFAQRVRQKGMKVWLTVHYSDTWADPALQEKPATWSGLNFTQLKTAVSDYTTQIITEIQPDIIQIGNETNDGMLWPEGRLSTQENQYLELVTAAVMAVRNASNNTKIMLHHAGTENAAWYFDKVAEVDYDYIGLSYYPIWHGKDLNTLKNTINALGATHQKKVVLAETAYPFTLDWNDWTNNIVGLENQLITGYPASVNGQKEYLNRIKTLIKETESGIGFCYWGSEWVAFRGTQSTNGSSWENQALWDFSLNALPALEAFSAD